MEYHDKELADKLGNFVNRVIVLTNKYYEGRVPESKINLKEALAEVRKYSDNLQSDLEGFSFKSAAQAYMEIATVGNVFLQDAAPWAIWKTDPIVRRSKIPCL